MPTLFQTKAPPIMALMMQDFAPLTVNGAAAFLGNFGWECGGFLELTQLGGGGGYGWPQWSGTRRTQYEAYCARNGLDPASDKANYGFIFVELKGAYANVLAAVRNSATLEAAVAAVMNGYEKPAVATENLAGRIDYANQAIAAYNAAPKPVVPLFATSAPATTPKPTTTPAPAAPAPTTTQPPAAAPAPSKGSNMGNFILLLLPMVEQFISANLPSIEQTVLTQIEAWAESLFTTVNKANPATPDKTVVSAPAVPVDPSAKKV